MQDAYNLTWKIALVIQGYAQRSILKTYQSERRRIAQELIDFDHKFSRLFSGRPAKDAADEAGISMEEFKSVWQKGGMFASGLSVDYGASMLVAKAGDPRDEGDGTDVGVKVNGIGEKVVGKQEVADGFKLGMRFPSYQVLNQSDGNPWQMGPRLRSDGRFRIILFAGNVLGSPQRQRVDAFCARVAATLQKFTPKGRSADTVIELLTIHSAPRKEVELLDLPDVLHPFDEETGWDYDKVYVDDISYHHGHGEAYKNYGVDKEKGCVVALRPDQYVGWMGELEDAGDLERYFEGILVAQG